MNSGRRKTVGERDGLVTVVSLRFDGQYNSHKDVTAGAGVWMSGLLS